MVKILVIGASQGIGLAVGKAAARGGFDVRAMSRRGTVTDESEKHIEAFAGDALRPDDVSRALAGIDVVVQALGVPPSLDLILKPVTLFSTATRVLLPAMKAAGVHKLVCVTGFGAGDSNAAINILQRLPFKVLLQNAYNDKSIQEDLIVASDLDWLIVRPGVLTSFPASGDYQVLTTPQTWRNGIIARADVADFIVTRIATNHLRREKPVLIRYPL
jgi:putative NADH-flavin reductase